MGHNFNSCLGLYAYIGEQALSTIEVDMADIPDHTIQMKCNEARYFLAILFIVALSVARHGPVEPGEL